MKYFPIVEQPLDGFTAIVPGLSYRSIPQKFIDLLLTSGEVVHIGRLDSEFVLPSISIDFTKTEEESGDEDCHDADGKEITTSIEVYSIPDKKIVLIQQRMPALAFKTMKLTREFIQFFEERGIKNIVALGSIGPRSKVSREMIEGKMWYVEENEGKKEFPISEDIKELISSMDKILPYDNYGADWTAAAGSREQEAYMSPLTSGYLYECDTEEHFGAGGKCKKEKEEDNKYKTFHKINKSIGNTLSFLECTKLPAIALITSKTATVEAGCEDLASVILKMFDVKIGKKPLLWDE